MDELKPCPVCGEKQNAVILDKPYSSDKVAEAIALAGAVMDGECAACAYLHQCESDQNFKYPDNAPCMIRKYGILAEWKSREEAHAL